MFVERLRPKILSTFLPCNRSINEDFNANSSFVFEFSMKKLGEGWFNSLFSDSLNDQDLLRVWDNIFICGFEFVQKFALILLSKNEKSYLNSISHELEDLKMGIHTETLIIVSNLINKKLIHKKNHLDIQASIKKALFKQNYCAITRESYLNQAMEAEKNNEMRVSRLRVIRDILEYIKFRYSQAESFIMNLKEYSHDALVSRKSFSSLSKKKFNWSLQVSTSFFIAFDQAGLDSLSVLHIKIGLALLMSGIDDKISLIFKSFNKTNSGFLSSKDFELLICSVEEVYDRRNTFYVNNIHKFTKNQEDVISEDVFKNILKTQAFFTPMINYLKYLDSNSKGEYGKLREICIESVYNSSPIEESTANTEKVLNPPVDEGYKQDISSFYINKDPDTQSYEVKSESIRSNSIEKFSISGTPKKDHPRGSSANVLKTYNQGIADEAANFVDDSKEISAEDEEIKQKALDIPEDYYKNYNRVNRNYNRERLGLANNIKLWTRLRVPEDDISQKYDEDISQLSEINYLYANQTQTIEPDSTRQNQVLERKDCSRLCVTPSCVLF
jgi:hypothetical protein